MREPASSGLEAVLAAEIRQSGPISVARYMTLALHHPIHGYYRRGDPLGAAGDFVTAPEVSQAFGEVIGAWLAQAWADLGRPAPFRLVELGPGRGTLMGDLLRATRGVAGFDDGLDLHLVECSPPLRSQQAGHLGDHRPTWHDAFAEVPPGPLLLIANEFFDALPAHQLMRTAAGWVERLVALDPNGGLEFRPGEALSPLAGRLVMADDNEHDDPIAEVSPARDALAAEIGARIVAHGGVALVIDYGAWADGPTGDTLQAVRGHGRADPLAAPGDADLTTHVDFRALAEAARAAGAAVYGPVPQGTFLNAFGVHLRTAQLLRRASPEQQRQLRAGLFRLTDAGAMGEAFKVLVLARRDAPPPPGFTAATLASC